MSPWLGIASFCLSLVAAAGPTYAQGSLPRLVVLQLETAELEEGLALALNEYLLTQFQASERYEVLGGSDVVAMLENEAQKQLLGCDDQECLAEIAGAMNAKLLASASVGKIVSGYLFSVKIINVQETRVIARASVEADASKEQLMRAVRTGVRMVTETSSFIDQLPKVEALPLGLWGAALATLGTGIAFGVKARNHHQDFMNPAYADAAGAARAGRQSQLIADLAFGTSLLSAASGVLVWWFTGERVHVREPSSATVQPLGAF